MGPSRIGQLKKRAEFLKVAAARAKWVTPGLILQADRRQAPDAGAPSDRERPSLARKPGPETSDIRVGFTASRRVGNAVQRNRARRRLRAVARAVLPVCGQAGTDYVLIGRRDTLERPYADLTEDLRTALRRLARAKPTSQAKRPRNGEPESKGRT